MSARPTRDRLPAAGSLGGFLRRRTGVALGVTGAAFAIALGAAVTSAPLAPALILVGIALTLALLGPDALVVLAWLGAWGLVPFVNATVDLTATVDLGPGLPTWFLLSNLAVGGMLALWAGRQIIGRPARALQPSLVIVLVVVLLAYTVALMIGSSPFALPSSAAPFVLFPVAALATWLWLSHDAALEGVRRSLYFVVPVVATWALAYIGGATEACPLCVEAVQSSFEREGLLGGSSRLYTSGQEPFLALVIVVFARALKRPAPIWVALAAIAVLAVALQASRAQYLAVVCGLAVAALWKARTLTLGGKLVFGASATALVLATVNTAAGDRAVTGYYDLVNSSGTAATRLRLLDRSRELWEFLGTGITSNTVDQATATDLGLPITLVILGFLGAGIQIAILLAGAWRGLISGGLVGSTLAGIFVLVLVARPSLPLIELGHSTSAYAIAVGFAASLRVERPHRVRAAGRLAPRPIRTT